MALECWYCVYMIDQVRREIRDKEKRVRLEKLERMKAAGLESADAFNDLSTEEILCAGAKLLIF